MATIDSEIREFSTVADIQSKIGTPISGPTLNVEVLDDNNDMKPEEIEINFSFKKGAAETVHSLNILTNLDYQLINIVNTEMKTLIFLPFESPSTSQGIASASLTSTLELKQKHPLATGSITRNLYDESMLDLF